MKDEEKRFATTDDDIPNQVLSDYEASLHLLWN
jgi:hypothetical protein